MFDAWTGVGVVLKLAGLILTERHMCAVASAIGNVARMNITFDNRGELVSWGEEIALRA